MSENIWQELEDIKTRLDRLEKILEKPTNQTQRNNFTPPTERQVAEYRRLTGSNPPQGMSKGECWRTIRNLNASMNSKRKAKKSKEPAIEAPEQATPKDDDPDRVVMRIPNVHYRQIGDQWVNDPQGGDQ
jgi:hypothetical protein